MASKTISLTDNVYNLLSKLKLPNESFGDVINRLCSEKLSSDLSIWIKEKVLWADMNKNEIDSVKTTINEMRYIQ